MFARVSVFVGALLLFSMVGCSSNNAWVYVDNGSSEKMTVMIDGNRVSEVEAGVHEKIVVPLGVHEFTIESGGRTVYSQTQTLEPAEEVLTTRRYLLNPDGSKRYWVYRVQYGKSLFEGAVDAIDKRDEVTRVHSKLCKSYDVLPKTTWMTVPQRCHVLCDAPESAVVSVGATMKIPVLSRVSPEDCRNLEKAKRNSQPSLPDLELLETSIVRSM